MPFALSDGARIYWRADGRADAPPLILMESLGSDHSMWDPVLPVLARFFCVIRIDKRGHGASDAPRGDYSIEQLGRDVLAVADAAGVARFRYLGLSIGGMTGMWLGSRAADRIERMVLTNTSAYFDPKGFDDRIAAIRAGGMAAVADAVIGRFFTPGYAARNTVHYHSVRQTLLSIAPEGYIGCCAAIRDSDLPSLLPDVRVPTLVVAGTYDPSTPAEHGQRVARAIPGASYVEYPTAHFGPSEAPEPFCEAVLRFLLPERTTLDAELAAQPLAGLLVQAQTV